MSRVPISPNLVMGGFNPPEMRSDGRSAYGLCPDQRKLHQLGHRAHFKLGGGLAI